MTDYSRLLADYVRGGKLLEVSGFTRFVAKQFGVVPHMADGRVNDMRKEGAIVIASDGRIDRVYPILTETQVAALEEKWMGFREQYVKMARPATRS